MSRRRTASMITSLFLTGWVVCYAVALATADQRPGPVTAALQLVVPPLLCVLAARLVLRHRWSRAGTRPSAPDLPVRLLAAAVAALPAHRREWGMAMTAELAGIQGRPARRQFAISAARAALWLPPAGGWPLPALVTGAVAVAVVAVGPAVSTAVPGLRVFAMTFTGLVGAMLVLAVTRARRPALPAPLPTVLVTGAVAAAIAATVVFLRRDPSAAQHLPPAAAVYLATVLSACLGVALAPPRWLGAGRPAPHLGVAAGVGFAAWFLLSNRTDGTNPPLPIMLVLAVVLVAAPIAAFFVPAFVAGRRSRSLRCGLQAAVWTVAAVVPLTYALWLPEALRRHAIDGRTLDGELVAPVGVNLADALAFCLGIFPVLGLLIAMIGAALGARHPDNPGS